MRCWRHRAKPVSQRICSEMMQTQIVCQPLRCRRHIFWSGLLCDTGFRCAYHKIVNKAWRAKHQVINPLLIAREHGVKCLFGLFTQLLLLWFNTNLLTHLPDLNVFMLEPVARDEIIRYCGLSNIYILD
ncbi:hypothetical protein EM595_p0022 (plasmid) [Duffyella gerundensis]|uniref:Uncharacterized protein n=1 Tax=Duffyella gerundensis TaxID=1619313 RepID=A0A0U5L9A7_9GAMM|nr:hypothetical protein EM595_p0022 [Duffyella gerundensis]